jgi:hypothetical protein
VRCVAELLTLGLCWQLWQTFVSAVQVQQLSSVFCGRCKLHLLTWWSNRLILPRHRGRMHMHNSIPAGKHATKRILQLGS